MQSFQTTCRQRSCPSSRFVISAISKIQPGLFERTSDYRAKNGTPQNWSPLCKPLFKSLENYRSNTHVVWQPLVRIMFYKSPSHGTRLLGKSYHGIDVRTRHCFSVRMVEVLLVLSTVLLRDPIRMYEPRSERNNAFNGAL